MSQPNLSAAGSVAATRSEHWSFTIARGREGLRAIAAEWADVLSSIEHPHFFQTYDWYDVILETWPEEAENVFFVVGSLAGTPRAICPLQLSRIRTLGMPVRMLAPPDPNAIAYSDFVWARSPATRTLLPSLLRELQSRSDIQWDILTLPRMLSVSSEAAEIGVDREPRFFRHPRGICYYFRCDEGLAAIQKQISGGQRKHLRWCRRQLAQMGTMEVLSSRRADELPRLLEEFLELEASGWKGAVGEGTAIRLHPDLRRFYSGLMSRFAETGRCEINLLRLDGRNIAGQFCLISDGTWYHLKIAYDEGLHKLSPGFVLLEDVLGRLCDDESIHTANLLTGAEWADRWHPSRLEVTRLIAGNQTLLGALTLQELKARRFLRSRAVPLVRLLRRKASPAR